MLKKVTKNSLASILLCGMVGAASAQSYPTKTITIVVPFPPGGTTDVLARAVAQKLGLRNFFSVICWFHFQDCCKYTNYGFMFR